MKLTTSERGEHHVIVPRHGAVRVGTLHRIFVEVAQHFGMSVTDVNKKLFLNE